MVYCPPDLKYTKEHEWAKVEDGVATIGITDYAQQRLTDVVFVELPPVGKVVEQFAVLAVIESVKSVSDVYSPLSGEVIEVNDAVANSPELVNQSPYGEGWLARLRITNPDEVSQLMSGDEYQRYLQEVEGD